MTAQGARATSDSDPGQRWVQRAPRAVAIAVAAVLAAALLAVVAVDVLDVLGVRHRVFVVRDSDYPWLFHHLFSEGHPVEWLQWLLLVLAAAATLFGAGHLHARGDARRSWGVALLGLCFGVLAVKDSGNPRHTTAMLVEGLAGSTAGTLAELAVFGVVGLLALAGLVAAWPELRQRHVARRLYLAGYATYALAAVMSATSDLWYRRAGSALLDGVLGGRMLDAPAGWEPGLRSWLLMDSLVEESVELVAACLLAVAALVLLRDLLARAGGQSALPVPVGGRKERG